MSRDMARAIEWAIGRSANDGGRFLVVNVGSDDRNYQIKDVANAVAEAIPGTKVSIDEAAPARQTLLQGRFLALCLACQGISAAGHAAPIN